MKDIYRKQVELLLDVLEISLADSRVALKGGTAINLFHRNFPRYSVDIDLCYLPIEDRETTFKNLHEILGKIKEKIEKDLGFSVKVTNPLDGKKETKLIVTKGKVEIKIEPNFTLRGCLYSPEFKQLSKEAIRELGRDVTIKCLNYADTYGGKMCAALDRQHPRDLFDIKFLLENEGITKEIKDSFLFYLISHNRPINELLVPNKIDIDRSFEDEFKEMSKIEVSLDELKRIRDVFFEKIKNILKENDKKFLISFVSNKPDWSLVHDAKIKDFPSIKWKLMNQGKIEKKKLEKYISDTEKIFS